MHDCPIFIFAALLIFGFGLFSRASERSPISAAMVFVTVGMVAGPIGLGFLKEGINAPLVRIGGSNPRARPICRCIHYKAALVDATSI